VRWITLALLVEVIESDELVRVNLELSQETYSILEHEHEESSLQCQSFDTVVDDLCFEHQIYLVRSTRHAP